MEWFKACTEMIGELGWPSAFVIVACIFKKQILVLLGKIKKLQWGPFSAEVFGHGTTELPGDKKSKEILEKAREYISKRVGVSVVQPTTENIDISNYDWKSKAKELYWLGHDLMYIKAVLVTGAPKQLVFIGFKQAFKHMKNLGFGLECNSYIRLSAMMLLIHKNNEEYLSIEIREDYAKKIQRIIYVIGKLTEEYQDKEDS